MPVGVPKKPSVPVGVNVLKDATADDKELASWEASIVVLAGARALVIDVRVG